VQAGYVQPVVTGYRGESGRVVAIHEVAIRGKNGVNDGTLVGGGVGAAGGAVAGAAITNSVGGAVVGGVLGAVAGGIVGTAVDQNKGKRGIEVTIQRDDGQQVTIAQPDNGDIQMGDRVMIVYDRNGVAHAIRDQGRAPDYRT
jgi:outer membrane lipoprotein SlyB